MTWPTMLRSKQPLMLFQRTNLPFAPAILRKLAPYARQRHRVGLSAGLKVTVLAGKATAREALGRVDRGRADLVCGIRKEGIAVFDEFAERVVSNRANARRRPFREIDLRHVRG